MSAFLVTFYFTSAAAKARLLSRTQRKNPDGFKGTFYITYYTSTQCKK